MGSDNYNKKISLNEPKTKQYFLEKSHEFREVFLQAIQQCDWSKLEQYRLRMNSFLKEDSLDIFKRIPNNKLRSFKNFLLSHNTLYSYSAEKGGLNAARSHYMSEKYAIMIEHTNLFSQLIDIHEEMIDEYSDSSLRYHNLESLSIAEKVEFFIEINFSESYSVKEIAEKIHVHPSHLMRTFKKEKGITISHYRNKKRVIEAKKLLRQSNLPLIDIAIMVGFSSSQYFSKIFKEVEGCSPNEYKNNINTNKNSKI